MKISSLIIIVLSVSLLTSYNRPAGRKLSANKDQQQAQQDDPASNTANSVIDRNDLSGNWVSNYTSMHATIHRSKSGYYVQYNIDNGNGVEFYGYYKFKDAVYRGDKEIQSGSKSVLVCDNSFYEDRVKNAYNTLDNEFILNTPDGMLNNEFVSNSSFKISDNSLVFGCDRCETTILHRVK